LAWALCHDSTDANGVLIFEDTTAAGLPRRFYRATWPLPWWFPRRGQGFCRSVFARDLGSVRWKRSRNFGGAMAGALTQSSPVTCHAWPWAGLY